VPDRAPGLEPQIRVQIGPLHNLLGWIAACHRLPGAGHFAPLRQRHHAAERILTAWRPSGVLLMLRGRKPLAWAWSLEKTFRF